MKLYTVGYEGMDIEDFCEAMTKNKIQLICDLRKNPVSRKKGFSKRLLAENLQRFKIDYLHLGALGVPTEWRKQAKEELITRKKMFRDYVKKIIPHQPQEIEQIRKLLKKKRVALLCYEAEACDCHRSFVAQEISKSESLSFSVQNLEILPKEPSLFQRKVAKKQKQLSE